MPFAYRLGEDSWYVTRGRTSGGGGGCSMFIVGAFFVCLLIGGLISLFPHSTPPPTLNSPSFESSLVGSWRGTLNEASGSDRSVSTVHLTVPASPTVGSPIGSYELDWDTGKCTYDTKVTRLNDPYITFAITNPSDPSNCSPGVVALNGTSPNSYSYYWEGAGTRANSILNRTTPATATQAAAPATGTASGGSTAMGGLVGHWTGIAHNFGSSTGVNISLDIQSATFGSPVGGVDVDNCRYSSQLDVIDANSIRFAISDPNHPNDDTACAPGEVTLTLRADGRSDLDWTDATNSMISSTGILSR